MEEKSVGSNKDLSSRRAQAAQPIFANGQSDFFEKRLEPFDPEPFQRRRDLVAEAIGSGGAAVLFGASNVERNAGCDFPFRQNSYFYYLTGFEEPNAALVIDGDTGMSTLFCQERDPELETWTGKRAGLDGAVDVYGFEDSADSEELFDELPDLLKGKRVLSSLPGASPDKDAELAAMWFSGECDRRAAQAIPESLTHLRGLLDPMRQIKDETEILNLERAAAISAHGHLAAMRLTRPGMTEREIQAEIEREFTRRGSKFPAYGTIVGSGANACILHYVSNDSVVADGAAVMVDAGAEYRCYAGDVSRTYPANGKFSPAQRRVYEAVLRCNELCIAQAVAGNNMGALNKTADEHLCRELIDLGLIKAGFEEAMAQKLYRRFYMHSIGHFVGLDVHDVGRTRRADGAPEPFAPNMCFTVEPGLYIPDEPDIPPEFRGIGARIEDNVRVTPQGPVVYTCGVPKAIDEVEAACGR